MSNARPERKPIQDLYEAKVSTQALAQYLLAGGLSRLIIAGILIHEGLHCLSDAGVSRSKARETCERICTNVKWRNQL